MHDTQMLDIGIVPHHELQADASQVVFSSMFNIHISDVCDICDMNNAQKANLTTIL